MADIMQTVLSVLTSPSARQIDFHLGLIHVDAAALALIQGLVSHRKVLVEVVASTKPGAKAQYSDRKADHEPARGLRIDGRVRGPARRAPEQTQNLRLQVR